MRARTGGGNLTRFSSGLTFRRTPTDLRHLPVSFVLSTATWNMNVIILTPDFPPYSGKNNNMGGIGTWMYDFALGLRETGHDCGVICYEKSAEDEREFDPRQPFRIIRLKPFWRRNFKDAAVLAALMRLRKPNQTNVFMAGIGSMSHVAVRLGRLTGARSASVFHGNDVLQAGESRRLREALQRIDVVIANSRYTRGLVAGRMGDKPNLITINPFLNPERFPPSEPGLAEKIRERRQLAGKKVILTTGRIVARKNHRLVIEALPELLRREPDVVYLVAGNGPQKAELEALARRLDVASRVHFLGFVSQAELRALYELADVFVMPSLAVEAQVEGFGIVFLEANLFGTPVIGGNTGGMADAIEDGVNGFLVDPQDPQALVAKLAAVLSDGELHRRMVEQGRARAEQFLLGPAVKNAAARIEQLLK
jgi:phosphatidylinositol alpha-1,6-mannosyltransferase